MAKLATPKCEQCGVGLSYDCGRILYVCQGSGRHVMTFDRFHDLAGTPANMRRDPVARARFGTEARTA